jgi:hypothetical protein
VFLDYQLVSIEFGVTETPIPDVYDIVLEATYQTFVPAPVVLLEPLSINLPQMQQGEEITGELTLNNYGMVRADNLKYALPTSDENFKYEFFGELPTQLAAKARHVIQYRITSLKALTKGQKINLQAATALQSLGASYQPGAQVQEAIRQFLSKGDTSGVSKNANQAIVNAAAKAASCSSYQTQSCVAFNYECAAGDERGGAACSSFSRVTGNSCSSSGPGSSPIPIGDIWIIRPPGDGGDGVGAPDPRPGLMSLVPTCMPSCPDCGSGGAGGSAGGGGGAPPSWGDSGGTPGLRNSN